ncbi:hypothetical protein ABEX25_20585 [Paenibacillus thiaminolyticus]|uniref:hypothetical protein n=1 Tax=Paenibacillus thiaminolyticus TaxID=49283 RepID=UPI003D286BD6
METTKVRIYGVRLEEVQNNDLIPIETSNDYPFFQIIYCGFKSGDQDMRLSTNRFWIFKKSSVLETGKLNDFMWGAHNEEKKIVEYFDMDVNTHVYEKQFLPVKLSLEITKPQSFGSSISTAPRTSINIEDLSNKTREELENMVASMMEMNNYELESRVQTMIQTNSTTWYGVGHREDAWGGDPDYE